ncbi:unnamed protein product [Callosobruchus maculatus]|uniref:Rab proteins geranylgeranyltransferase component A n=1 Tax=Callosobruchus maculatus TaxID=64391 RepID=A0A653CZJ9_CALMS|nr:unnamed protein product [Callosobruchus maculatus]
MDQLPTDFDVIIVGTGIVESILSAAASRIGKRVLHIDRSCYYGGQWASFSLEGIIKLQEEYLATKDSLGSLKDEQTQDKEFVELCNNLFDIKNIECTWHVQSKTSKAEESIDAVSNQDNKLIQTSIQNEKQETEESVIWNKERLLKESRKFNIDLVPKLQYARGDFVELLISSNIARYSEFKSLSRVLTWLNGRLEVVPCSRSDVFSNDKVSVIEKRMLMKLLTNLEDVENDLNQYQDKTYKEYLKDKKLTPNLIHYVLYAISLSDDGTLCKEGIKNTKRFLGSLGRFGKTPFLFSMYGSGEMPQAFCRLSAVFGGIYALGQPVKGLTLSENKFKSLLVNDQKIEGKHLILNMENTPKQFIDLKNTEYIARCILITDRSIMSSEAEHLTLLLYPPENDKNSAILIELGTLTGTCPKDLHLVHITARQKTNPKEDFQHIISNMFNLNEEDIESKKPKVLWSCYFSLPDSNASDVQLKVPDNVFLCTGPDIDLDYDFSVKKAKEIFSKIYPDEEFLPRAPDPEEIVIEGEDEETEDKEVGDKNTDDEATEKKVAEAEEKQFED